MATKKLLARIEDTWNSFQSSHAGLTSEQMEQPGVAGDWSIKDILAHVTTWEEESLKHLPMIAAGEQPARYKQLYGGIDAFNGLMVEQKRRLSLNEVLGQLADTHRQLIDYVNAAPSPQFASGTRSWRRIGWDTFKHYPLHEKAIREWRERSGI